MDSINFKSIQYEEPTKALSPYVKFYLSLSFEAPDSPLWIPADRRNQILILKRGKVKLNTEISTYEQAKISVRHCFDTPLEVRFSSGMVEVIAIEFTPVGLHYLFDFDMKKNLNQIVRYKSSNHDIHFDEVNRTNFKSALDRALLMQLSNSKKKYSTEILAAIQLAEKSKGKYEIAVVPQSVGMHPKTFYRFFKKYTGLTPKRYFSITQFESAILEIIKNQSVDRMDLVTKSGYYDQSHLIKAIQKFSGSTPDQINNLDSNWIQFLLQNNLYH
ncbi:helix-turn-helix domain-containing protein [Marivirga salinae]|uniref:Helix-turn-helix domain-containing protein n=1 Tax=Marivirga salinarum TaxID=3059078 RepID=A0AA49GAF7_9BACT|nr:helix-turn-helix domain-containing protein [Marivirga sp. BDSF4-3]WKK75075.2 helix-turn-helix domain-containing protein [Marivirga sp. BDSF4-3]